MRTQATDRTMLYRSADAKLSEYARLRSSEAGCVGDGTIVGLYEDRPLRVRWEVTCDSRWHARNVSVEAIAIGRDILSMSADDDGIWRRVDGGTFDVPIFNCLDVAIECTPVPAALTIRRLGLAPREAAIVHVASIDVPSLTVRVVEHRYTCLVIEDDYRTYRLEDFDSGRRSELRIDVDGVVAAHEGAFTRVWPSP